MNEPNSKPEQPQDKRRYDPKLRKKGLRCDLDQYEMLKRCWDKKDMSEWNKWRDEHSDYNIQDVLLEGGDFSNWHLEGVNFGTNREYGRTTPEVYLKKAKFNNTHLEGAHLYFAHMEGAELYEVHLDGAKLGFTFLNKAFLLGAHLEDAYLENAKLHNANVCNAHLERASLRDSELDGTQFNNAYLQKAKFQKAYVDGKTSFCYCKVDRETDFSEVALDNCRIDPAIKQLLEYNIRRKNWEEWYKKHPVLKLPVLWFWCVSNYGLSTWRIIGWFLGLALFFAAIYSLFAYLLPPGIVSNLELEPHLPLRHYGVLVFIRPIYFSIVTMTTLGFGDMYANAQSIWGHILLTIQVTLGYVLLGALVTRFAVLFTAGGPAGSFADEQHAKTVA
jgi:uncharacterized protein YjbI with pentapeptide repeats